jgi:hypothetical protein
MSDEKTQKLREELGELRAELAQREAAMPAHSARPHQLQAIEDLEDRIAAKERELERL